MKKKTAAKALNESLARLIESELDKAEVILSIKAFTDKLQNIAEDLAKTEANDIMPMLDVIKETFGPQVSEHFNKTATDAVAKVTDAVKFAKDSVSNIVMKLEQGLEGGDFGDLSDMAMDGDADLDMTDDAATDMDPAGDMDAAADADIDAALDDAAPEASDDDMAGLPGDEDPFGPDDNLAAGRAKKESIERNVKALRESKNPDALVANAFRKAIREGASAKKAAFRIAESFNIDVIDVIEIIKDAKAGKG